MKIIKRLIVTVIVAVIIAGVALYLNLNRILKSAIQTQATSSLNLTTTLDSADLSPFGGKVSLGGLQIASPTGFTAAHILELGKVGLSVNYSQLKKQPIHISSITLDKPHLVLEQSGMKTNLQAMMDQMPKSESTPPPSENRASDEPVRLIIDQLDITGAVVDVHPGTFPGVGKALPDLTLPIPDLDMKNIGNADGSGNGAAIKDVVSKVIAAMAEEAEKSGKLDQQFAGLLKGNIGQLRDQITSQLQGKVGDLTKTLPTPNLGNVTKGLGGAPDLGNLLGQKKDSK